METKSSKVFLQVTYRGFFNTIHNWDGWCCYKYTPCVHVCKTDNIVWVMNEYNNKNKYILHSLRAILLQNIHITRVFRYNIITIIVIHPFLYVLYMSMSFVLPSMTFCTFLSTKLLLNNFIDPYGIWQEMFLLATKSQFRFSQLPKHI